jgi:hypothetical protein
MAPTTPGGGGPWRGTGPELAIASATYVACAVAAYLTAGAAGAAVVSVVAAALALAGLRALLPASEAQEARTLRERPTAQSISGYSRRRYVVAHSAESAGFYETDLRPVLEHILAARLAENHGTNLYASPEAARSLLGDRLWYWVDPGQADVRAKLRRGIPPRTLARLIDRLERL